MNTLPEELDGKVRTLKKQADDLQMEGKYLKAIEKYQEALSLLPEPANQWKYIWILLPQIAENYWLNARFNDSKGGGDQEALTVYEEIMQIKGAIGDEQFHARIGQIRYELGQLDKAKEELLRAYLLGGKSLFDDMNETKYYDLIKPIVEGKMEELDLNLGNYQF